MENLNSIGHLGRPKKNALTTSELVEKGNRHDAMTLDEAAKLMASAWYETRDPKTGEKRILEPMKYSVMGLQKFEQRTLAKLRSKLVAIGINGLDDIDMFTPKFRMPAKQTNTREY